MPLDMVAIGLAQGIDDDRPLEKEATVRVAVPLPSTPDPAAVADGVSTNAYLATQPRRRMVALEGEILHLQGSGLIGIVIEGGSGSSHFHVLRGNQMYKPGARLAVSDRELNSATKVELA